MKTWLLDKFTGFFGVPITALISATVGGLVGKAYAIGDGIIHKIPWMADLAGSIWAQVPPEHQVALSAPAVGAVVGAGTFAWIQQSLNKKLRGGNKDVQATLNAALPEGEKLKVDGIPGPKTHAAAGKVAFKARRGGNPKF